ncbi:MAG: hypothetical protein IJM27_00235 [Eubacterium sp.]|nr:hypothetical protein [Eubacterium sp.]
MEKTKLNSNAERISKDFTNSADSSSPHDIYDRMFKRIERLSNKAVISFINGVFQKDYPEDSTITYSNTEFIDHTLQKVVADKILTVNGCDSYHMEAQLYEDDEIVIRFMEYGFHHALSTITQLSLADPTQKCTMRYPQQILIYLDTDPSARIPDEYPITILFPSGEEITHRIPVLKFQEKKLSEIRDRHMVILLPFRLLRLRKRIEKERSKESVRQLLLLYRNDIIEPIDKAYEQGFLTWKDRLYLMALARRLSKHLYERYEEIREDLKDMSNPYIELDIDKYMEKYDALEEEANQYKEKANHLEEQNAAMKAELVEKDNQLAALQERVRLLEQQTSSKGDQ